MISLLVRPTHRSIVVTAVGFLSRYSDRLNPEEHQVLRVRDIIERRSMIRTRTTVLWHTMHLNLLYEAYILMVSPYGVVLLEMNSRTVPSVSIWSFFIMFAFRCSHFNANHLEKELLECNWCEVGFLDKASSLSLPRLPSGLNILLNMTTFYALENFFLLPFIFERSLVTHIII